MTTQEIATRLVSLCREGRFDEVYEELFDTENVLSIEPDEQPNRIVKGVAAIKEKGKEFNRDLEAFHGSFISDPLVAGNAFSLLMSLDATFKGRGRVTMNEICLYEVKDGKIVKEQFFF